MTSIHYHRLPTWSWADDPDNTYLKKARFLEDHDLPGVEEVKGNIGCQLADIFFREASDGIRACGYNNIYYKDKITEKIQSMGYNIISCLFTSQVGGILEEQYMKDKEQKMEEALMKQKENLRAEMEIEMAKKFEDLRVEMEDNYRHRLHSVKQQITIQYQEIMAVRDRTICKEQEERIKEALSYLRQTMTQEMELTSARRDEYYKELNQFQRLWEANKTNELYRKKTNNMKKKCTIMVEEAKKVHERDKAEALEILAEKHRYEMEKIKKEYKEEYDASLKRRTFNYRKTIVNLLNNIKKMRMRNKKLKEEKDCLEAEQYSWCYLVRELLKQFQKFINYAIRCKPGHVEYLLCLDRLLKSRIESLTEKEFLRDFIENKGAGALKGYPAQYIPRKLQKLEMMKEEDKAKPFFFPCRPGDTKIKSEEDKMREEAEEALKSAKGIMDKIIKRSTPMKMAELPCIDPALWMSDKSDSIECIKHEPKSPGVQIVGETLEPYPDDQTFLEQRIKSLVEMMHKYHPVRLAIVGSN